LSLNTKSLSPGVENLTARLAMMAVSDAPMADQIAAP
jgi:hypothetical protein